MIKVKYTENQIEELNNNKYVKKCSSKNITYTTECKVKGVNLWKEGKSSKEIFTELGFPEYIIKSEIPGKIVCMWNRLVRERGENAFGKVSKRGRKLGFKGNKKININKLTDKEKIKYLETENAYLKELYKEKHGFYP